MLSTRELLNPELSPHGAIQDPLHCWNYSGFGVQKSIFLLFLSSSECRLSYLVLGSTFTPVLPMDL